MDVDKEGYLRHEASSSETASDSESIDSESIDLETVNGGITFAITTALKQYGVAKENLKIIWPLEVGSVIMCIELDLKHALNLIDLKLRGDPALKKRVYRRVSLARSPIASHSWADGGDGGAVQRVRPGARRDHLCTRSLYGSEARASVTLSDSDVNRAVKRAWLRMQDRKLRRDRTRSGMNPGGISFGDTPSAGNAFVVPDICQFCRLRADAAPPDSATASLLSSTLLHKGGV